MTRRKQPTTLICLPYAGGNSHSYTGLTEALTPDVDVVQLDLPGRGRRSGLELLRDIHEITEDVMQETEQLRAKPYALFGHSMGAVVSYLLCCRLRSRGDLLPTHLFVSGCAAPHALTHHKNRSLLPTEEFFAMLSDVGDDKESPFQHEEFRTYIEPILRADFHAVDTYEHQRQAPLPIPIRVFMGTRDAVSPDAVMCWQDMSTDRIAFFTLEGGHFFLDQHPTMLARVIKENLCASAENELLCPDTDTVRIF